MEKTLDLVIRSKAENAGFESVAQQLERQIGRLKALGKDYSALETKLKQVREAQAQFAASQPGPENTTSKGPFAWLSEKTGGLLNRFTAGMFTLGSVLAAARQSLDAFGQSQERQGALAQSMANKGLASPENIGRMRELAAEMQHLTGIGQGEWTEAITRLFQSGADLGNIDQAIKAVEHLAAISGKSLKEASVAVGKALNGNTESLRELGITIDSTLPKHEKVAAVFRELSTRGGGLMEARLNTLNGQWQAMTANVRGVTASIGGLLARTGIAQAAMGIAGGAAEFWAEQLGKLVPQTIELTSAASAAIPSLQELGRASERVAAGTKAAADASKKLLDLLQKQKALSAEKSSGEQAVLEAGKGVMEARIAALKQQGFVGRQDFAQLQKAGLITGPMGQMWARSRGGAVSDTWYTMLEANLNSVYARQKRDLEKKALAEQQKLEQQAQEKLKARQTDLLNREEQAEQRTRGARAVADLTSQAGRMQLTAAELDQAAKEAKEQTPSASAAFGFAPPSGKALEEFQKAQAEEKRLKEQAERVRHAADAKNAQAEQVKGMFPKLGTMEQEGGELARIRGERQKLEQALADFQNEVISARTIIEQKTRTIHDVNKLDDVKQAIQTQTLINESIFQKLRQQQSAINGLK